jgi:hypothetical protein
MSRFYEGSIEVDDIFKFPRGKVCGFSHTEDTLTLYFTGEKIQILAIGECCSSSKFEFFTTEDGDWHQSGAIIGKEIWRLRQIASIYELPLSEIESDAVVKTIGYFFETLEGEHFPFALRNFSNGYYSGFLESTRSSLDSREAELYAANERVYESDEDDEEERGEPLLSQILMVVGLPASGKSCFILQNKEYFSEEITIFDDEDIIEKPFCLYEDRIYSHNSEDQCLCFLSSRFVVPGYYTNFLARLGARDDRIKTLCFLPDVEQSVVNNRRRGGEEEDVIEREIYSLFYRYDPRHSAYINVTHLPTYKSSEETS